METFIETNNSLCRGRLEISDSVSFSLLKNKYGSKEFGICDAQCCMLVICIANVGMLVI